MHSTTRLISILTVLLIAGFGAVSPTQVLTAARVGDSILRVPVSRQELGDHERLLARVKDHLSREPRYRGQHGLDLVVVFTDESGGAILPDSEAEAAAPEATEPKGKNALSFTFDSPRYPWTPQQVTFLSAALKDFYPVATDIYGPPAFNITVNIRRDPTLSSSSAGLYFPSINEMVLGSATADILDVLCHELLHAFRDDDVISLNTFEEGMTRAAEIEIFDRLPAYVHPFDEAHGYEYDVYYELLNRREIGSPRGSFYDGWATLLRYQLAGYAWGKVLIEDDQFLARFNTTYYRRLKRDSATRDTEAALLNIAASIQHHVEGEPFETWYSHQYVLNTAPPTGFALYRLREFTIYFFERDPGGSVRMMSNTVLDWRVSDYNGALLKSGSGTTTPYGWLNFFSDARPAIPSGYSGRLELVGSALTPQGALIENTTCSAFVSSGGGGVFGVVRGDNEGTVEIKSLEHQKVGEVVTVTNGAFIAPSVRTVRGRSVARFFAGGELKAVRFFNKDASDYFLRF
jgi:hypothetical protein